ncbi:hypothetical protein ABIB25_002679 [Nakamurella sp. UYEF19]
MPAELIIDALSDPPYALSSIGVYSDPPLAPPAAFG